MSKVYEKKTVAIISAMEIEIAYVEDYLKKRDDWNKIEDAIFESESRNLRIVTKVLGVGKVNAAYQTADLINEFQPVLIINVGYAGGLVQGAQKGELVIGKDYVQVDFLPYIETNKTPIQESPADFIQVLTQLAQEYQFPSYVGTIATGDFFLNDSKEKERIKKEYQAVGFDMESAAIAQVATQKKTEFIAVRTFSDLADEDALEGFNENMANRIPIEQRPIVLAVLGVETYFKDNQN